MAPHHARLTRSLDGWFETLRREQWGIEFPVHTGAAAVQYGEPTHVEHSLHPHPRALPTEEPSRWSILVGQTKVATSGVYSSDFLSGMVKQLLQAKDITLAETCGRLPRAPWHLFS